jgi:hypothetical protein
MKTWFSKATFCKETLCKGTLDAVPANIGSSGMRVDNADEDAQTTTK